MLLERIQRYLCPPSVQNVRKSASVRTEHEMDDHVPLFEISQSLDQDVKVDSIGRVKVVLVQVGFALLFGGQ